MKTKRRYTPEEREAKRDADRQLAKDAVEELRSSEGWRAWIGSRSRFHRYSFGNQVLIAMQSSRLKRLGLIDKTPNQCAGFAQWLKLGYCVRKRPEDPDMPWAIRIWARMTPSKRQIEEAKKNGERPRAFFKLVSVFGDTQVDPLPDFPNPVPLEPPIRPIEGDDLADAYAPLVALALANGCPSVDIEDTDQSGGYLELATLRIAISEKSSPNGRVKTLLHEISHLLVRIDRQEDDPAMNYDSEELVAESVAMSVTGTLGLDSTDYSIPYLASWSEDVSIEDLERTAKLVNRLASRIEDALPEELLT